MATDPFDSCHCLCGLHGPGLHGPGVCTGDAEVLVEMAPNPYARVVPMCRPCAQARSNGRGNPQPPTKEGTPTP